MIVVGDGQDAVLGFIKHCVYVFAEDNWNGYNDMIGADCKIHWIGFLVNICVVGKLTQVFRCGIYGNY